MRGYEFSQTGCEASAALTGYLETFGRMDQILLEWKELHDLLQRLQTNFSLVRNRARGRKVDELLQRLGDINLEWGLCRALISNELVPFAEGIKYIGEPYKREDDRLRGEEWAVKIVNVGERIDEALKEESGALLKELIGSFDGLVMKHIYRAELNLEGMKGNLDRLSDKLSGMIGKIEAGEEGFAELKDLVKDLKEFVDYQKRLLEWIGLHGLFHEIQIFFTTIYSIVSPRRAKELTPHIASIESNWRSFESTLFEEFVTFAKNIEYIGKAYSEDARGTYGEEWIVELVAVRKTIERALRELRLKLLREAIGEFHRLIRKHFIMANRKLKETADSLDKLLARLLGRIER